MRQICFFLEFTYKRAFLFAAFQMPLALFGGSGNYASALYIAAVKANSLDKVESELFNLVEAIKKSPTFAQFTMDLSVPAETRVKAIDEISAEAKFSEVVKNFLGRIVYTSLVVRMKNVFFFWFLISVITMPPSHNWVHIMLNNLSVNVYFFFYANCKILIASFHILYRFGLRGLRIFAFHD